LLILEEKIASLVHDLCEPVILPEISFLQREGKHIIHTQVFKGSAPPYHMKNKTVEEGTFIRVGSTNRLASAEILKLVSTGKSQVSPSGFHLPTRISNNSQSYSQSMM